jgi:hypothetical protein
VSVTTISAVVSVPVTVSVITVVVVVMAIAIVVIVVAVAVSIVRCAVNGGGSSYIAAIMRTGMITLPVAVASVTVMFTVPIALLSLLAFAITVIAGDVLDCGCCSDGILYWESKG